MTDWVEEMADSIKKAASNPEPSTIVVSTSIRKILAKRALDRLAPHRKDIKVVVKEDVI
jgi:hypothetical protein